MAQFTDVPWHAEFRELQDTTTPHGVDGRLLPWLFQSPAYALRDAVQHFERCGRDARAPLPGCRAPRAVATRPPNSGPCDEMPLSATL